MMKNRIIYYPFILLFIIACNSKSDHSSNNENECHPNYELLKGNWQSSDFWDSYTEIEIFDSLRCYVNHGEYVGPTTEEEYAVQNDTLFRIETGQKYQICIKDSLTIILIDHLGHKYELNRFERTNNISDWNLEKDSIFDAEFLSREKEFNKKVPNNT